MFYNMGYSSLGHFTAVKTQDREETLGLNMEYGQPLSTHMCDSNTFFL